MVCGALFKMQVVKKPKSSFICDLFVHQLTELLENRVNVISRLI